MAQADNSKGLYPLNPRTAPVTYLPIKATQTLTKGDAVILSSGQVAIALAGSATICGVIARDCASLAAATEVPVYADPDTLFVARQDGSDALTVGSEQDLIGATGAMQLDSDASTTDVFKLVRELDYDETDAAGKRWVVKINKHDFAQID